VSGGAEYNVDRGKGRRNTKPSRSRITSVSRDSILNCFITNMQVAARSKGMILT